MEGQVRITLASSQNLGIRDTGSVEARNGLWLVCERDTGDLGSCRGTLGHPSFQLLTHGLFLGLNSDPALLCHLLRGELEVSLGSPASCREACYQTQGLAT